MKRVIAAFVLISLVVSQANAAHLRDDSIGGWVITPGELNMPGGNFVITNAANNDGYHGSFNPNRVNFSLFYTSTADSYLGFMVDDDGQAATEYRYTVSVRNDTGEPWVGYRFELGFNDSWPTFVPAAPTDPVDFDWDAMTDAPTASIGFSALDHTAHTIEWSGGPIDAGESVEFGFSLDVGDGLSSVHPTGASLFILKQTPIPSPIPEPSTLFLILSSALALVAYNIKRRRR